MSNQVYGYIMDKIMEELERGYVPWLLGKDAPPPTFAMPGFYRHVRHPIMLGFIIAFWSTPTMTVGHLLFAIVTTIYMLVAIKFFEERDLVRLFGAEYESYRKRVSMLIPLSRNK